MEQREAKRGTGSAKDRRRRDKVLGKSSDHGEDPHAAMRITTSTTMMTTLTMSGKIIDVTAVSDPRANVVNRRVD